MLDTLAAQLHFVRAVQAADTTGVEPLRALRDETEAARKEAEKEVLDACEKARAKEEIVGKYYKRIRRRTEGLEIKDEERDVIGEWKPLEHAEKRVGKYFVVERGQKGKVGQ
jgi:Glu-tRNAGln amidotransferase C subunit